MTKIEPYGYVSEHNCEGPFKTQFHKARESIYPDNCIGLGAVYSEVQMRQLGEACAALVEPGPVFSDDQDDAFMARKLSAAAIRNLIKEMLP
jgi:hypothetical protein